MSSKKYKVTSVPLPLRTLKASTNRKRWEDFAEEVEKVMNDDGGYSVLSMQVFPDHGYQIISRRLGDEHDALTSLLGSKLAATLGVGQEEHEENSVQQLAHELFSAAMHVTSRCSTSDEAESAIGVLLTRSTMHLNIEEIQGVLTALQTYREEHAQKECVEGCEVIEVLDAMCATLEVRAETVLN